jgi:branched-chain amino acid transport system ATP-binding protein
VRSVVPLLAVDDLVVAYDGIRALHGLSIAVREGEIVSLIGANGAGKSTLLRAISGLVPALSGRIVLRGKDLRGVAAHEIVARGVAHVPEGRGIFANLTVRENLVLGSWCRGSRADLLADFDRVFGFFPRLKERLSQVGGTLSGGEQQMLAVGRALMTRSHFLLLDEPSMGLAPRLVEEIFGILEQIHRDGTTLLLVEQNARRALKLASRAYVLEAGRLVLEGPTRDLFDDPRVTDAYLGGG